MKIVAYIAGRYIQSQKGPISNRRSRKTKSLHFSCEMVALQALVFGLVMTSSSNKSFDSRSTLSRDDVRTVYDKFATQGHVGGKDADSGYGGPAVSALLEMADFENAESVVDYGCGQGKLCELALSSSQNDKLFWQGIDQSPKMRERFMNDASKGLERIGVPLNYWKMRPKSINCETP